MLIESADAVFIRARRRDLHPLLADLAGYGQWWPGVSALPLGAGVVLELRPPGAGLGRARRRQRLVARRSQVRPDLGVHLAYLGTVTGGAEWSYLDAPTGVVVHYLLRAHTVPRHGLRTLRDHRACARAGLHALKDRLEGRRAPGQEPEPALLEHQRHLLASAARARHEPPRAGSLTA